MAWVDFISSSFALVAANFPHSLRQYRKPHIEGVAARKNELLARPVAVLALAHDRSLLKIVRLRRISTKDGRGRSGKYRVLGMRRTMRPAIRRSKVSI
jgi:hypothetical protein